MTTKNFAIIGAAGYIAPRHMQAIKDTGNNLIVAYDPHDSVGILDKYSKGCQFFPEFNNFIDYLKKNDCDYVSICSPNYLHYEHVKEMLENGCNVICEKPLVLDPRQLDEFQQIENKTHKKIYCIFQLRFSPLMVKLKEQLKKGKTYNVEITYITPRGDWYLKSWKNDIKKSGGLATNIGAHLFDLLTWFFGSHIENKIYHSSPEEISGNIEFPNAKVLYHLSINNLHKQSRRSITVNNKEFPIANYHGLHTENYKAILNYNALGINEVRKSIQLMYDIRAKKGGSE